MKKHIKLLSSISFFFVLSAPVFTLAANGDEEVRKKRSINKSYTVSADDKLEIENSFGNVMVTTWDKNEITVDIDIVANAPTEEKAQDIMNEIDVKEIHEGHIISFKTKVGEIHNGGGKRNKDNDEERAFYIDYVIHMPSANRLQLENSFGKTAVPDFNGLVSLTSKFGSLTAGKLRNVDEIDVEFGKVAIDEVSNGKVTFKFNKESRIGKVTGNVKISSEFSHNVQFNVGDDIKDLSLFESYSGIRMIVTNTLSASIDVHTSFGHFLNDSQFTIRERREDDNDSGPRFDKDYSGKAGDGNAKIKIKSSFGTVRFTHSSTGGGKDKEKDKDKDKDDDDGTKTS
ncbi:MAG TPA: hypothetical protein VL832_07260 [Puia sp.]|nr:hypothetical protein [Puia sp.]